MDARLLGSAIVVRVLDTASYQLDYELDGQKTSVIGEFMKELSIPDFDIRIEPIEMSPVVINYVSNMDFELRVHAY